MDAWLEKSKVCKEAKNLRKQIVYNWLTLTVGDSTFSFKPRTSRALMPLSTVVTAIKSNKIGTALRIEMLGSGNLGLKECQSKY